MPDLEIADLTGKKLKLSEIAAKKPLVVALTSTTCPVSRKYAPALARLEDAWRSRGVGFLYVVPLTADGGLAAAAKELGLEAPVARDPDGALARALGAITTTDVFLLDAARTLVYRGAVDDQYGLGYALDAPKRSYLAEAVDALLAGRAPATAATWAPGCDLDLSKAPAPPAAAATWHNRISRIVQRACQDCHRKGGLGPFALETYAEAVAHKAMIRRVVEGGTMPPWFAAPTPGGGASPWANDSSLSAAEKKELLAWLAGGLPEGVEADAPLPRKFPEGWRIGKPEAVFELPRAVDIKAEGTMPYVNLEVDTGFAEERWVSAIEIVPTAPEVVHHVLVFALPPKGQPRRRSLDEGIAYFAVYVPGQSHVIYPEGYGRSLPPGARLKFQMHYTPNGKAAKDRTKIGFVFSKTPPKHAVKTAPIVNPFFTIPPGAENHEVKAAIPVPRSVEVLSYFPHMHLRGKSIRYEAVLPGDKREVLLNIPRYDFNWQYSYAYAERRTLPAGTRLEVTGWFDNSKNNPANPDPTQTVRWGEQTHEEMLIGFVEYVVP